VRERIAVLALVALAAACAACSGGSATSAAPSGGAAGGAPAASQVPAICVNVASLRTTVQTLTMIDPAAGVNAVRMAANNVATQTATFVSAAPLDLREAAKGLKTAVAAVRASATESGAAGLAAAIAGMDAAWKEFETKLAAVCPS
jgi:hypothetical protein